MFFIHASSTESVDSARDTYCSRTAKRTVLRDQIDFLSIRCLEIRLFNPLSGKLLHETPGHQSVIFFNLFTANHPLPTDGDNVRTGIWWTCAYTLQTPLLPDVKTCALDTLVIFCVTIDVTRKLSYRKDDRAMRPIYRCPENLWESLSTPTATFPDRSMNVRTKFEVRSFIRSWDNWGYFKTLGSPTLPFLQNFNGLLFGWTLWMYRPNLESV